MDTLRAIADASTPLELHRACFAHRAEPMWDSHKWAFLLSPRPVPTPWDLWELGHWGMVHDADSGLRVSGWALLVDLGDKTAWELAVHTGLQVMTGKRGTLFLLPPDTHEAVLFDGDPVDAIHKAFNIVLGVGQLGQMERLRVSQGPEVPNFPKVYGKGVFSVKGQTII